VRGIPAELEDLPIKFRPEVLPPLLEPLARERFEGGNVNALVLRRHPLKAEESEFGNNGLSGPSRRAEENALISVVEDVKKLRLDGVEAFKLGVVEGFEPRVGQGGCGKGGNVSKISVREMTIGEEEVLKRYGMRYFDANELV
jgi:hypothetical protein